MGGVPPPAEGSWLPDTGPAGEGKGCLEGESTFSGRCFIDKTTRYESLFLNSLA